MLLELIILLAVLYVTDSYITNTVTLGTNLALYIHVVALVHY